MIYDVLIIGGGPAGLTAGIYTSRAGLKTLVFCGSPSGGQLMLTTDVDNFPGFPTGILGPNLIQNFKDQASRFGAELIDENVQSISGTFADNFTVVSGAGVSYVGSTVILATGASAKWLELPNEQRLRGHGVSACATCDAFFFKEKVVAVVGGGDVAMEDSVYLTKFASKVYVLVRKAKGEMKASKIMQEKAFSNPKIEFFFDTEVIDVLGSEKVSGLKLCNSITGEESVLDGVSGVFVAIGHSPNTDFVKDFVELEKIGYMKVFDKTKSSKEGVFVAGDVADFRYRQAISAAGSGCMAAIDVSKFLAEHSQN